MSPDEKKRRYRNDLLLASVMVAAGIAMSGLSLARLAADNPQIAQMAPPQQQLPQSSPDSVDRRDAAAESKAAGVSAP